MKALVACECSGRVREALRRRGVDAWSNDIKPAEDGSPFHIQDDARHVIDGDWDLLIAHPVCTRMANSGVRWLYTDARRWPRLFDDAKFFRLFLDADHIPMRAVENSIMHKFARQLVGRGPDQVVQPWWFGAPAFKGLAWWLHGLPKLVKSNPLIPPKPGTDEHKAWSKVHMAAPSETRAADRARTEPEVAEALAEQWAGDLIARAA